MFSYVVRRVIAGVVLIVVMSLATFILFFAGPSQPALFACGRGCTPDRLIVTTKALGYDKPAVVQWGEFMKGVFKGRDFPDDPAIKKAHPETIAHCPAPCLGHSLLTNTNVRNDIAQAFPVSASLAMMAFVIWIVGGVLFGVTAALKKGTMIDRGIVGASLVFFAFPTFFVGLFLHKF
ncbi:MAG: binding-protein-dependent transport system inner rane component, partial [Marmoricola sp.]|nr:binding-protein-dependent transport system inner rane component [Marmoricola sp.]